MKIAPAIVSLINSVALVHAEYQQFTQYSAKRVLLPAGQLQDSMLCHLLRLYVANWSSSPVGIATAASQTL